MPLRPTSTMVQEQNPDGQSPHHDPQHSGPVNPVPASQFGQTPAFGEPPQASDDHDSWLLGDGGALDEVRVEPSDSQLDDQNLTFGDAGNAEQSDSWLLSGEVDEVGAPAPMVPVSQADPLPVAGDLPEIVEASFVSADSGGSLRAFMIPVSISALLILGGLAALKFSGRSGGGASAPEAVALTEDLHQEQELVAPQANPELLVSLDGGPKVIDRNGDVQPGGRKAKWPVQRQQPQRASKTPTATEQAPELTQTRAEAPNRPGESMAEVDSKAGSSDLVMLLPIGPFGTPPPPAWASLLAGDSVAIALAKPEWSPAPLIEPSVESAEPEAQLVDSVQAEADLLAWLNSDEDLPFYSIGSMGAAALEPQPVTSNGAPAVQPEPSIDREQPAEETSAAIVVEPVAPVIALEPEPIYLAGPPLTLEPLWPGEELDLEALDDLVLSGVGAFIDDTIPDAEILIWPSDEELQTQEELLAQVDEDAFFSPYGFLGLEQLPGQSASLTTQVNGPLQTDEPSVDSSVDFSLGRDPTQWAQDLPLVNAQDRLELQRIEAELDELEAELLASALPEELPAPEVESKLMPVDPLAGFQELLASAEELELTPESELPSEPQPALEPAQEPEPSVSLVAAEEVQVPQVADEAPMVEMPAALVSAEPSLEEVNELEVTTDQGVDLALAEELPPASMANASEQPEDHVEPQLESEVLTKSIVRPMAPSIDTLIAKEPEPRSLLETYSDWMRIQDVAPAASRPQGGLTGVRGHESLPYGLAQLASGDSSASIQHDPRIEVGESQAPRRGGVLRRASGDHRWDLDVVPEDAIGVERKLLTPNVGPVRIVLVDGDNLEGRLHAVGFGMIWIETSLGRMSLEDRRVQNVFKLDPKHVITAPGDRRDYSNLPRVRVAAKGGVFVGHQLSRDGARITLVTDDGSRITLEDVEIMPARQFRPVGLRRASLSDGGSPASPK